VEEEIKKGMIEWKQGKRGGRQSILALFSHFEPWQLEIKMQETVPVELTVNLLSVLD